MIGTFWNLCRACPSMPIDKSRSEYRSTYQWYEYTGHRQEVVKQAPQLTSPTKPEEHGLKGGIQATLININKNDGIKRTKENTVDGNVQPEVNIKKNPIYGKKDIDYSLECDNAPDNKTTENSAVRLRSRNDKRDYAPSRRSKSEGPPGASNKRSYYTAYGSPSPDYADVADFDTDYVGRETGVDSYKTKKRSEITTQDEPTTPLPHSYHLISNYPEDYDTETAGIPVKGVRGNTEYRLQFAWPKSHKNEAQEELKAAGGGSSSRRSAYLAPTGHERPPVPVHKKRFLDTDKKDGAAELEPLVDQNGECDHEDKRDKNQNNDRLEFYSEYKKKFRPFSQYDYIAGKFLARDNNVTPASSLTSGSWYTEVVELRKKAGEYKHRGWGTELVPQHLAEVYNKQIALWEHVSRRSSLSALTLATTTQKPRALTKEEKGKENSRKLAPHRLRDSSRQTSVDRSASVARKKTEKDEEIKRHSAKYKDGAVKGVEKPVSSAGTPTSTSISSGRSQHVGGSPKKYPSSRPPTSGSPKKAINQETRARPTTLATNAQSRIKRDTSASAKKRELLKHKISPASVKIVDPSEKKDVEIKSSERDKTDDVDAGNEKGADEVIDVERIVKSPPEPTRVKSPEQLMMRSPEPVNWTVPLDTGKTFTVTQNIHDGDLYHHRPPSESKILSTLHHGPHSLDSQNITSHKSQDDTASLSLEKFDDTSIEKDTNLNGTDDKSHTSARSVEEHPPEVTSTNGKYSEETTSEEKHSPVSEHSDSNVKSPVDQESLPFVPVTGISPAEVDSARDRFEQFWGKPKYEMNGKESSM